MRELEGKVAGVTGGSGRIGRGLAQRFLQAGMRVVLADLDVDGLKAAEQQLSAYGAVIGVPADLSKREHVEVLALRAVEEFGAVHVLCNDAGLNSRPEPALWELPYQEWQTVVGGGGCSTRSARSASTRSPTPRRPRSACAAAPTTSCATAQRPNRPRSARTSRRGRPAPSRYHRSRLGTSPGRAERSTRNDRWAVHHLRGAARRSGRAHLPQPARGPQRTELRPARRGPRGVPPRRGRTTTCAS